jgi:hypothetical protein
MVGDLNMATIINFATKEEVIQESTEAAEILAELLEDVDDIEDIIIIVNSRSQEGLTLRSSKMNCETAYFMLGQAQLTALGVN